MSEKQNQVEELSDDIFDVFKKKMEEDVNRAKQGGSFTSRTYEDVAYCGLETGINKIVRLIGAPPGTPGYIRKPHDPIVFFISKKLKDQKGKQFDLRLPPHDDVAAKDHIVHRLVAKVNEVDWIKDPSTGKNKKVSKYETRFPELWDAVNHTGYDEKSDFNGYKYCSGLGGKKCVTFNVLDRSDSWCRENKHTKVLVKDLSILEDGRIFVNGYMPANGFIEVINSKTAGIPELGQIINKYGNYEKYDIAIYRTGQMNPAYKFYNASKLAAAGMLDELRNEDGSDVDASNIGAVGPMTIDELTYERYDLTKMFQPTSYQKIERTIGWVFKLCDGTLGTKFYDELEALVKDEKERYDEIYRNEEKEQGLKESAAIKSAVDNYDLPDDPEPPKPASRRTTSSSSTTTGLTPEKIALLKGWDLLDDHQKSLIEDVSQSNGKTVIKWKDCDETKDLLECDDPCLVRSPESFTVCPGCGQKFE